MPDYAKYKYGRIATLARALDDAGVAPGTRDAVMQGGETIKPSSTNGQKADWMRGAMARMDTLMDREARNGVREACACCLGGKRGELARRIAKDHQSLEDRVKAADETKFVFGHGVALRSDGKVLVSFAPEGLESYRCVCLRGAESPISMTYCYCCGGHVKHHLQAALGRELKLTVRTSALSSGGAKPCTFLFELVE